MKTNRSVLIFNAVVLFFIAFFIFLAEYSRPPIGDDVLIAPNTFVNFDVPSHSVVIGNPATIHPRKDATKGHIGVLYE